MSSSPRLSTRRAHPGRKQFDPARPLAGLESFMGDQRRRFQKKLCNLERRLAREPLPPGRHGLTTLDNYDGAWREEDTIERRGQS